MKPSKRILIAVPLLIAGGVGLIWALSPMGERSSVYSEAAGRYREYYNAYRPRGEGEVISYSTCYGERWDRYTRKVIEDRAKHTNEPNYLTERAIYYRGLADKYRRAAAQPWRSVRLDPPLDSP